MPSRCAWDNFTFTSTKCVRGFTLSPPSPQEEAIHQVLLGKCTEGEEEDKLAVINALGGMTRGGRREILVTTKPELSRQYMRHTDGRMTPK